MASSGIISIYCIASYFSGHEKLIQRGENAVKSGHVAAFGYDADTGRLHGKVEASMENHRV